MGGETAMFKRMKLGTKIMVGFGVLIALAMALGGLAAVKMKGVVGDSVMLAEEYAPEAQLASDLERRVYRTMYAVRGFHFTGEKKYHEDGAAAMAQVQETIGKAEELAARAEHLTQLKNVLGEAKKEVLEYDRLMRETEKNVVEQERISNAMLAAAKKFMDAARGYLNGQNELMRQEIKERRLKSWPSVSSRSLCPAT
jgi:methyl-accepting chemotaxis protein